jgi:hypothetical protein
VALVLLPAARAVAQVNDIVDDADPSAEFHFVRLMYNDAAGGRRGRGWGRGWGAAWTDWPDAEYHLMEGVRRLTRVDGQIVDYNGGGARRIRLDSDRLFEFPWLYAVEVGQWYLDDTEAALLREYLDRGGFLMVDDFWGEYEWSVFVESMLRVFPDRPIVELPETHPLLHVLYDLDQRTQIPGRGGNRRGTMPHWRGIFDDDDRLMVAINFNMDMGDAWEHADDPWYPEPYTALAYRFAVNYLIYSMTH